MAVRRRVYLEVGSLTHDYVEAHLTPLRGGDWIWECEGGLGRAGDEAAARAEAAAFAAGMVEVWSALFRSALPVEWGGEAEGLE